MGFPLIENPEVILLNQEKDLESLMGVFTSYFAKSKDDILKAIKGEIVDGYDFSKRILLGIRKSENCISASDSENVNSDSESENSEDGTSNSKSLSAACIVVAKKVNQHQVLEVVWLATNPTATRIGVGSTLFSGVLELGKRQNVSAVLVTSTNRALSWWLSRKNCSLCKYILRAKSRCQLANSRLAPDDAEHERNLNIVNIIVETRNIKSQPFPTHTLLESLYSEKINRNRKGKPAPAQTFRGSAYRYDIDQSNHLWYLISPHLKKHLGCVY